MSATGATLAVDICGYWITGDGTGRGFLVDRGGARDGDGLPFLPGRHLRGLLRDAVRRALAVGMLRDASGESWSPDAEAILFGVEGRSGIYRDRATGFRSAGLLEVRDARLPDEVRDHLLREPDSRAALTRTLHQTAMLPERGVARSRSLRVSEVFVPMRLSADIGLAPFVCRAGTTEGTAYGGAKGIGLDAEESAVAAAWRSLLSDAMCLVEAVGGGRNHGLGRAHLSLVP